MWASSARERKKAKRRDMHLSDINVLIVDDQTTMRSIIRDLLRKIGLRKVVDAENIAIAEDVLRADGQRMPNLIISDLYMDKGGGLDLLKKLRDDPALRALNIPVILLTGETNEKVLNETRAAGAKYVLAKPCSAQDLGRTIAQALGIVAAPPIPH